MNKQNVKVYSILLAYVLVIFGTILGASMLLKPVKEKNIMKVSIKKYTEVLEGIETLEALEIDAKHNLILEKQLAKDSSGKALATLYTTKDNNGYGSITMIIAIDETGLIKGSKGTDIAQTLHVDKTEAMIKSLKGTSILDEISGVTGATVSSGSVENMLNQIKESQNIVSELDIYEELFGAGYVLETNTITATTHTKESKTVKNNNAVVGSSYVIEGEGDYNDGDTGIIKFNIILNTENQIIGYEEITYTHTGGNFKKRVLAYLDELVTSKTDITSYEAKDVTKSTNSGNLLNTMLEDLSTVVGGK